MRVSTIDCRFVDFKEDPELWDSVIGLIYTVDFKLSVVGRTVYAVQDHYEALRVHIV